MRWAAADILRELQHRHLEHHMRQHRPANGADSLYEHEPRSTRKPDLAAQQKGQRHRRVEMCPRHRPENGDQNIEDRAGRNGVAKKGDGEIPVGKPFRHDAGADDRCQKKQGAKKFGDKLP